MAEIQSFDINKAVDYIHDIKGGLCIICSNDDVRSEVEKHFENYTEYDSKSKQAGLFSKKIFWSNKLEPKYNGKMPLLMWVTEEDLSKKKPKKDEKTYPVISIRGYEAKDFTKKLKSWCKEYNFEVEDSAWNYICQEYKNSITAKHFIANQCLVHGKVLCENLNTRKTNEANIFDFHRKLITKSINFDVEFQNLLVDNPPMKIMATLITLTREWLRAYVIVGSGGTDSDLYAHFGKMTSGKLWHLKNNIKLIPYEQMCHFISCLQKCDEEIKTRWKDAETTLRRYMKLYLEH